MWPLCPPMSLQMALLFIYGWVIFHFIYVSHFFIIPPLVDIWAASISCLLQMKNEHWNTCIFFWIIIFLWICSQSDCWTVYACVLSCFNMWLYGLCFQSPVRLAWRVAMLSSRELSWPRDQTHITYVSFIGRWVLDHFFKSFSQTIPCLTYRGLSIGQKVEIRLSTNRWSDFFLASLKSSPKQNCVNQITPEEDWRVPGCTSKGMARALTPSSVIDWDYLTVLNVGSKGKVPLVKCQIAELWLKVLLPTFVSM